MNDNHPEKIIVTGANGQLGKELQAIASLFPGFEFIFFTKDELPIDNRESFVEIFRNINPQYLINCAAYTAVDKAEEETKAAFRINTDAVGTLAAICSESQIKFIHISTDYVFDGTSKIPYKEDDAVNPQSVYGSSKLKGEQLAVQHDPRVIIIRTSWVYSEHGKNFLKTMLKLMGERPQISVVNDQLGSPTYAGDLAVAILGIITSGNWEPGIYHYSNKGGISWFDFANGIKEITGSSCEIKPIQTSEYPTPAKRPAFSVLNCEKIARVYSLESKPWMESLKECLARYDLETGIN